MPCDDESEYVTRLTNLLSMQEFELDDDKDVLFLLGPSGLSKKASFAEICAEGHIDRAVIKDKFRWETETHILDNDPNLESKTAGSRCLSGIKAFPIKADGKDPFEERLMGLQDVLRNRAWLHPPGVEHTGYLGTAIPAGMAHPRVGGCYYDLSLVDPAVSGWNPFGYRISPIPCVHRELMSIRGWEQPTPTSPPLPSVMFSAQPKQRQQQQQRPAVVTAPAASATTAAVTARSEGFLTATDRKRKHDDSGRPSAPPAQQQKVSVDPRMYIYMPVEQRGPPPPPALYSGYCNRDARNPNKRGRHAQRFSGDQPEEVPKRYEHYGTSRSLATRSSTSSSWRTL